MHKLIRPVSAGLLACTTVFMALVFGLAHLAGATNIDVTASSGCVGHEWVMQFSARNTHNAPLDIRLDTTQGPGTVRILAPGAVYATKFTGSTGPFTWQWSSTNGHLIGTTSGTFTRPEGCTAPTTVPATTAPTTVPDTTAVATTVPVASDVSVATTAPPAPDVRGSAPADVPPGPPKAAVVVPVHLPASCFTRADCPAQQHDETNWGVVIGLVAIGSTLGCVIVLLCMSLFNHRR